MSPQELGGSGAPVPTATVDDHVPVRRTHLTDAAFELLDWNIEGPRQVSPGKFLGGSDVEEARTRRHEGAGFGALDVATAKEDDVAAHGDDDEHPQRESHARSSCHP
jgi:hypothetical protein